MLRRCLRPQAGTGDCEVAGTLADSPLLLPPPLPAPSVKLQQLSFYHFILPILDFSFKNAFSNQRTLRIAD